MKRMTATRGLVALLATVAMAGPLASIPQPIESAATGESEVGGTELPEPVEGNGPFARAVCMLCVGTILSSGGASVIGLALLMPVAGPSIMACAFICVIGFA